MKRYMVNGSEFWYDEGKQPVGAIEVKAEKPADKQQAPATKEAEPSDKAKAPAKKPRTTRTKTAKAAAESKAE